MTPADLAELLKATAAAVLAEHGLDSSVLPATVTVERPRNPEHGDYATNLALRSAKKAGVAPAELAGWLATRLTATDGIETDYSASLSPAVPAQRLAERILERHGKGTDDALAVVVRYTGSR